MQKFVSFILLTVMLISLYGCKDDHNSESETRISTEGEWGENYQRRYAVDFAESWTTNVPKEADPGADAMVFTVKKGTVISFDKAFCFDAMPVSRFSFGAAAADGVNMTLAFFLDDEEEPFETAKVNAFRSEDETEGMLARGLAFKDHSGNISAMNLSGDHCLRMKVLEVSEEALLYLCYVEFAGSTVPTIYLNIDESRGTIASMNASEDHSTKCYGQMTLQVPDGFASEYSDEVQEGGTYELDYLRGRGNSTWKYRKKPYKIKLQNKEDLLGMGEAKEWALIANYCDNSLLRNKITYWLGEQCGLRYTPQGEPVDVVLGGEYIGSYMLSETVEVQDSRVSIGEPDVDNPETVSGGYLISLAARAADDEGQASFYTDNYRFFMESPSFEDGINEDQMAYISNYVNLIESAVFNGSWETPDGIPVEDLLDFRSAAAYYLLQTFSGNSDAFITDSTFLYKERDGKLYFGPLWDFDFTTWGETSYAGWEKYGYSPVGSEVVGEYGNLIASPGGSEDTLWIGALFNNDAFICEFESVWGVLKTAINELTAENGKLDYYSERFKTTSFYNFEALGPSQILEIDPNGSFEEDKVTLTWNQEVMRLRDWLVNLLPGCEEHITMRIPVKIGMKIIDSTDNHEISTVEGIVYDSVPTLPDAPEKEGFIFLGYVSCLQMSLEDALSYGYLDEGNLSEAEKNLYERKGVLVERDISRTNMVEEGMYIKANYIAEEDYIPVSEMRFVCEQYEETAYENDADLKVLVSPENATLLTAGKIIYSSSDEDVVYSVGDGSFGCGSAGEAFVRAEADGVIAEATVKVS